MCGRSNPDTFLSDYTTKSKSISFSHLSAVSVPIATYQYHAEAKDFNTNDQHKERHVVYSINIKLACPYALDI